MIIIIIIVIIIIIIIPFCLTYIFIPIYRRFRAINVCENLTGTNQNGFDGNSGRYNHLPLKRIPSRN